MKKQAPGRKGKQIPVVVFSLEKTDSCIQLPNNLKEFAEKHFSIFTFTCIILSPDFSIQY